MCLLCWCLEPILYVDLPSYDTLCCAHCLINHMGHLRKAFIPKLYITLGSVCHCRQNNAMKIPSVSLEQTRENCVNYVVNPLVDHGKFQCDWGLWVIMCSSRISSRVSQDYFGVPQSGCGYESWFFAFSIIFLWWIWSINVLAYMENVCVCVCVCVRERESLEFCNDTFFSCWYWRTLKVITRTCLK
jgi:hypothetical protein